MILGDVAVENVGIGKNVMVFSAEEYEDMILKIIINVWLILGMLI